jgi:hypothetical protein
MLGGLFKRTDQAGRASEFMDPRKSSVNPGWRLDDTLGRAEPVAETLLRFRIEGDWGRRRQPPGPKRGCVRPYRTRRLVADLLDGPRRDRGGVIGPGWSLSRFKRRSSAFRDVRSPDLRPSCMEAVIPSAGRPFRFEAATATARSDRSAGRQPRAFGVPLRIWHGLQRIRHPPHASGSHGSPPPSTAAPPRARLALLFFGAVLDRGR